jgi:hypothetical protein
VLLGAIGLVWVDCTSHTIQGKTGMKQAILGQRRAVAVEGIGNELKRITGLQVDLTSGLKGNSEHRQLFMLERF